MRKKRKRNSQLHRPRRSDWDGREKERILIDLQLARELVLFVAERAKNRQCCVTCPQDDRRIANGVMLFSLIIVSLKLQCLAFDSNSDHRDFSVFKFVAFVKLGCTFCFEKAKKKCKPREMFFLFVNAGCTLFMNLIRFSFCLL